MKTRNRNTVGRYQLSNSKTNNDYVYEENNITLWDKMKPVFAILLILLMGLPWTVIIMQPTKIYGEQIYNQIANYTGSFRNNFCERIPNN